MTIYVLRHGQTDWNFQNKMLGMTDIALNETGVKQAEQVAKEIANLAYDMIYCSPLKRTRQTCQIVNQQHKRVVYDERIVERNLGVIEGKNINEFDYENYWIFDRKPYEQEESMENTRQRVFRFLDEVISNHPNGHILIITHNGVCRMIRSYFESLPDDGNIASYGHNNCELKIYQKK